MRDYIATKRGGGDPLPIARVPTSGLFVLLDKCDRARPGATAGRRNPGVTVEQYRERVMLELDIRSLGLGEID